MRREIWCASKSGRTIEAMAFIVFFSGMSAPEAPSSNHQAPEKHQIPTSSARADAPRFTSRVEPGRARPKFTGDHWNLVLGASLELGAWALELPHPEVH